MLLGSNKIKKTFSKYLTILGMGSISVLVS